MPDGAPSTYLDPNDVDQLRINKLACLQLDLDQALAIEADPNNNRPVQHHIQNIRFLMEYYEAGGVPPAPGDARWVKDGQFVDTHGRMLPEPYEPNMYTADPGMVFQL